LRGENEWHEKKEYTLSEAPLECFEHSQQGVQATVWAVSGFFCLRIFSRLFV